ncbi:hypothetical protein [Poseidonibacter ostreae]|nr:hypothetical protein [Poseidonibacter ostreae]KAB7887359.1 hypothetical protein GA417_03130 [Poseidonibacter ostreae]KAB7890085.1 hypothetical protein GBG18_09615 [Poseidonibacter ostreae]
MSEKLILGPLLSVEGDNKYVVCFLSKTDLNFSIEFNNTIVKADKLTKLNNGYFYRAEYIIKSSKNPRTVKYKIINEKGILQDIHKRES